MATAILGHSPQNVADIYKATEEGITSPEQMARVLGVMRVTAKQGITPVLNEELSGVGGAYTAQGSDILKLLALPTKQFNAAMQTLQHPTKGSAAAPYASALKAWQSTTGGQAVGITGGLESAGAKIFQGLAPALSALTGVLKSIQSPLGTIAAALGTAAAINALLGLGKGGSGPGAAGEGMCGCFGKSLTANTTRVVTAIAGLGVA